MAATPLVPGAPASRLRGMPVHAALSYCEKDPGRAPCLHRMQLQSDATAMCETWSSTLDVMYLGAVHRCILRATGKVGRLHRAGGRKMPTVSLVSGWTTVAARPAHSITAR